MGTWYWYLDTAIVMFVLYGEKYIINIIRISILYLPLRPQSSCIVVS